MKTFKILLRELYACSEAREWAGDMTIEEIVQKCHRGDWLLWLAARVGVESRPITLAKGHCANTVRHLMIDGRSIKAVDAAIEYGEGKIDENLLATASAAAAYAAADDVAAYAAAYAAADDVAAYAAAYAAAAYATSASYAAAAASAAYAAATSATSATYADAAAAYAAAAAKKQNQLQTADICRKYIGQLIIDKVNQRLNQKR